MAANMATEASFAVAVASQVVGIEHVDDNVVPLLAAEGFSFMLNAHSGAYVFVGNVRSAALHHPQYNFNVNVIEFGCSYRLGLIESAVPIE